MASDPARLVTIDPRPTAVVAEVTTWREFPGVWRPLLDEVYAFVRRDGDALATGSESGERWQNVMLYKDDRPAVEVGVLVGAPFAPHGRVTPSHLPGGRAAATVHRGDYAGLGVAHDAETEIFYLLG